MLRDTLVYDRTEADWQRLAALEAKPFESWTPADMDYWLNGGGANLYALDGQLYALDGALTVRDGVVRGAYNHTDYNRVGLAVLCLVELFRQYGYWPQVAPKTDWTTLDMPTPEQRERYLADVQTLRGLLPLLPNTPPVPNDWNSPKWDKANDIERILVNIETVIGLIPAAFRRCGTFNSGMEGIL